MPSVGTRLERFAARARAALPYNAPNAWPLLLAAAIAFACGLVFLELGEEIAGGELSELDDGLLVWLAARRTPQLNGFFLAVTSLGSWPVLALLSVGVCTGSWLAGQRRLPLTLALAMLGVPALSLLFKHGYARARPQVVPHLETVASASFPSGHTLASVTFFTTLALLAAAHMPRKRLRVFLVAYSLAIGALVALSRVYLGVHFPSDVLGGALIGVAWSLTVVVIDRALRGVTR